MASDWAIALSKKELTIVKRMSIVESVNGNSLGIETRGEGNNVEEVGRRRRTFGGPLLYPEEG